MRVMAGCSLRQPNSRGRAAARLLIEALRAKPSPQLGRARVPRPLGAADQFERTDTLTWLPARPRRGPFTVRMLDQLR